MCGALQTNSTLTEWGIGCNPIGREGAEAVANMLTKNKTLRALDFRATQMPEEELRKVVLALQFNQTLRQLNISWNRFNADGVNDLCKVLAKNHTLTSLNLANCGLDKDKVLQLIHRSPAFLMLCWYCYSMVKHSARCCASTVAS